MAKYVLKTIIVGDGGVGKTSIVKSFLQKSFSHDYKLTIGIDISSKSILVDDTTIVFSIHDLAGQVRFDGLKEMFMIGTQIALFVFDLTRKDSLVNLRNQWIKPLVHQCPHVLCLLIGNKSDLVDLRVFDEESITSSFQELQRDFPQCSFLSYVETSAKDHRNINYSFNLLGKAFLDTLSPAVILS